MIATISNDVFCSRVTPAKNSYKTPAINKHNDSRDITIKYFRDRGDRFTTAWEMGVEGKITKLYLIK